MAAKKAPALPGRSAKKATWVRYAVSQGVDQVEAKKLPIAAMQERFGVAEAQARPAPRTRTPAPSGPLGPAGKLHKITAPNRQYNGISANTTFVDGVGYTNHPGSLDYFRKAGYGIDDEPPAFSSNTEQAFKPAIPAIVEGTKSNDAAVVKNADGPLSDAFLPPTNAGEAEPHGPLVVSPGIHGVGPAPIVPGDVHVDDVARQEAQETAIAESVLVHGAPATIVSAPDSFAPPERLGEQVEAQQAALDVDALPVQPAEAPKRARRRSSRTKAAKS